MVGQSASIISMSKKCNTCKNVKPVSDFYTHKKGKRKRLYTLAVCKPCILKKQKRKIQTKGREYYRDINMKRRYGIGLSIAKAMLSDQMGLCANRACGKELTFDSLSKRGVKANIDHCHSTGEIRGILCLKCNTALGILEQRNMMIGLAEYLNKHLK